MVHLPTYLVGLPNHGSPLLFPTYPQVIFGVVSDRFGRKWPLISCPNLSFLALRSLFRIGMGGIWCLAASTALENLPVEARGVGSGVLQLFVECRGKWEWWKARSTALVTVDLNSNSAPKTRHQLGG